MIFRLNILPTAKEQLKELKKSPHLEKRYKAVNKAINLLKTNPRHSGLNIHPIENQRGPNGVKLWEAYAENNTPRAYRIFFYFGPEREMISILYVVPHPD